MRDVEEPSPEIFGRDADLDARVEQRTAELRRVNQALRESEERWRTLVDNTPDLIYALDRHGRHTAANRSFRELLGLREEQILGKAHLELGFPAEGVAKWNELQGRALAGELVRAELQAPMPDGQLRAFDVMLVPIRADGAVVGVRGVSRDVSDRKRLEEQLRHAQKLEAVGRLAGGVAHDFNNIMQVIQGFAALVVGQLRPEDPLRADVGEIVRAASRAAALTSQLLAFGRKSILQPRSLDPAAVVAGVQPTLGRIAGEGVELTIRAGPGVWPIRADRSQLEQVLANLVANAREALPLGGHVVIETANVTVDAERAGTCPEARPGPFVRIAVSDDGCGMTPEVQEHLFEPFFTTRRDGLGEGLGLATVHGIVSQMGGFVCVRSEPGRGTTLELYFPREDGEAERLSAGAGQRRIAQGP